MLSKVENKSQWQSLLDKALFKTFFHSLQWEELLENNFSWLKFERYVWQDELLISFARAKLLGKEKIVSHPFCEYGGPLPLKQVVDVSAFEKDFVDQFGERAKIKFHPHVFQILSKQPANPPENNTARLVTFFVEDFSKKSPDTLWSGFRKTLRQEIKKSDSSTILVGECESIKDLKQFYSLYVQTAKRHNNIPLPLWVFNFFYEHQIESVIYIAKNNGKVIGGSVFLLYKPFIHYFINASDYKYRNLNIGHKILWHVMQKYVSGEYDYFDLGGTRLGSPLETFKRGWGAEAQPIYELGGKGDRESSGWKRNMWGMLPASVIKFLAPYALYFKI